MVSKKKLDIDKCKHPNSRRTVAFSKQLKKVSNREKSKLGTAMKMNLVGEKYEWFQSKISENEKCMSAAQTYELINQYLNRFEEELQQIKIKHSIGQRKNRQHASREDIINMTMKRETEEFNTCGLEIPDVMNTKNYEALMKWNRELRFLQNLKSVRITKAKLEAEIKKSGYNRL
ncbi:PREDICTED: translation machinery-associated protein 16 [Nicrophorus vespilloides]|uniref:Translation machinery-associated protein 16 n=1 Tax=Nicrophorus vespilloides TaxID=110193 RepID=A0ABM1M3E9_NICVS|nr:PREDICTED: translation machinery-associated protein 16 [Nicrophorus vespilloides]